VSEPLTEREVHGLKADVMATALFASCRCLMPPAAEIMERLVADWLAIRAGLASARARVAAAEAERDLAKGEVGRLRAALYRIADAPWPDDHFEAEFAIRLQAANAASALATAGGGGEPGEGGER
jgi:hypothetical protein